MPRREHTWTEWCDMLWADPFDEPPFSRRALLALDQARGGAVLQSANALAYYTPRIATAYLRAAPAVADFLDHEQFQAWANAGQTLAPQHWELAVEYYRTGPRVVSRVEESLLLWVRVCRRLADVRMSLGITAMRHTPGFLAAAGAPRLERWVDSALRIAGEAARGSQLAETFLAVSAPVIARLPGEIVERWVTSLVELSVGAPGVAQATLDRDWTWFAQLQPHTAHQALDLAQRYRRMSPALAREWWAAAARALPVVPPEAAEDIVAIAGQLAGDAPGVARELIEHAPGVLSQLPAQFHKNLLSLTRDLAARDGDAALGFFTTGPAVCMQLSTEAMREWFDEGLALLESHPEAAVAYFRQESQASAERLEALRQVVRFETVGRVLQQYAEALSGVQLGARPTDELPLELQTLGRDLPTTDGRTIFLPPVVDRHGTYAANMADYKIAAAHQAGYYEFGTFTFDLGMLEDHAEYGTLLATARARGPLPPALSDFERFFTLFADPDLAREIFAACEDARIDQHQWDRYPGLHAPLTAAVQEALANRPELDTLPLRQAAMEWLLRLSLTRLQAQPTHALARTIDLPLRHLLGHVLHPHATVIDAARVTLHLYAHLVRLPNVTDASPEAVEAVMAQAPPEFAEAPNEEEWAMFFPDAAEGELPYAHAPDLPHRGVLRPELVQKRAAVQVLQDALVNQADGGVPLSAELLRQLLEMGVNINIKKLDLQQLLESSDLFITDLEDRPGVPDIRRELEELTDAERADIREMVDGLAADVIEDPLEAERVYYYDEWDADIEDYRHRWCRVKEVPVEIGDTAYARRAVREYAELIRSVREQFQLVKPEELRKVRRLEDGQELELDDAIAAVIDRKSRRTPDDKIYQQRERQERNVATLFLIDVSASTDEWVAGAETGGGNAEAEPGTGSPMPVLRGFDDLRDLWDPRNLVQAAGNPVTVPSEKRIIDIERDAAIIMAEALQGLGDMYAIYGFSGYGRENVDLFPVKRFDDLYGESVKGRLAGLEPHKSTRMGPAVRHAVALLKEQPARIRTLILISDGYPQDFDYGKDRTSKTYGLHDTMVALQEARQAGIVTFCITVDQAGHDYLRQMCGGRDYLVIDDVTALPRELPKVYRTLTG